MQPSHPSHHTTHRQALLRPSEELTFAWRTIFAKYDLTPPAGMHIISSVPGAYRTEDHGADALRRWLKHTLRQRAPDRRPARVEYCFSSMGRLENKLVWQPLKRALLAGAAEGAEVRLVWPAMATMLATMASRESRRQWWADAHGLVGPGEQWIEANWEPRAHFSHHIMPWRHRAKTYHHAKAGLSCTGRRWCGPRLLKAASRRVGGRRAERERRAGLALPRQPQLLWRRVGQAADGRARHMGVALHVVRARRPLHPALAPPRRCRPPDRALVLARQVLRPRLGRHAPRVADTHILSSHYPPPQARCPTPRSPSEEA